MPVIFFNNMPAKTCNRMPVVKDHTWALVFYREKFGNMYVITEPLKGSVIKSYNRLYSTSTLPLIAFE
jgi:hypothetical protein